MKALIPVAFVAGAVLLAQSGHEALAAMSLGCGFVLGLGACFLALTK